MAKIIHQPTTISDDQQHPRVVWLLQDAGAYWQPILSEFTKLFAHTKVFTGVWKGFLPGFESSFCVEQIGTIKVLSTTQQTRGYAPSITYLSPKIVQPLLRYKPDIIFTTAFSIWTILAVVFKHLGQWQIIVVYDGSSPGVEYQGNGLRSYLRKQLTTWIDAFVTNTQAGRQYLIDELGARSDRVIVRPYLVPHPKTYEKSCLAVTLANLEQLEQHRPVFMFAGNHIPRKGLRELLEACVLLQQKKHQNYSLLILGDGPQRAELQAFAATQGLKSQIHWVGEVPYEQVGSYLQQSDIFIFPTLEDVWGLVGVEAMLFGKPILCSKWAGTAELMTHGQNGFIFDPHKPDQLAKYMIHLIENPELVKSMGEQSRLVMQDHTPEKVAQSLSQVVELVLSQ